MRALIALAVFMIFMAAPLHACAADSMHKLHGRWIVDIEPTLGIKLENLDAAGHDAIEYYTLLVCDIDAEAATIHLFYENEEGEKLHTVGDSYEPYTVMHDTGDKVMIGLGGELLEVKIVDDNKIIFNGKKFEHALHMKRK